MLWFFSLVFVAAFLYVAFAAPVGTAVGVLLVGIAFLMSSKEIERERESLRRLAVEREGESICEFARDFDTRKVDTWIVRAVYEQLQCQLSHAYPAFPVRASDRLVEDLHIDVEDLDIDIGPQVEQRTSRSCKGSSENPYFCRVQTMRDLVMFFQEQPL
jgi:hypothetical protein